MTHRVLFHSVAALATSVLIAGCNCRNDVNYTPIAAPEALLNDHGQWLSMGVAPDGRLVTSYYDRDRGALGFGIGEIRNDGEVWWTHEQVDGYPDGQGLDPGDLGLHTSLAVVDNGDVWVAYYSTQGQLWAALRQGGLWTLERIDVGDGANPDAGRWASLALDSDNSPVIAYQDTGNGTLKIARRTGDDTWSSEIAFEGEDGVDDTGATVDANVGSYASLLIQDGTEYIAFHDAVRGSLELLEGFPGAYTHTTIEAGGVGQWPSMWTDGTTLLVAYHNMADQDLELARRDGSSWQIAKVDTDEYVGADTEVFRDTAGIGIVYFDGQFNDMRVARESGGTFVSESIGGESQALGYHNEIAYTEGQWFVASYDYTNRNIFTRPL
ncbi:MAG: hypothetical protein ACJAZO_003178 [Myxococcota bacterium]|jgi:hypothetical protein